VSLRIVRTTQNGEDFKRQTLILEVPLNRWCFDASQNHGGLMGSTGGLMVKNGGLMVVKNGDLIVIKHFGTKQL